MSRYRNLAFKSYVIHVILAMSKVFMGGQSVSNTPINVLTYIEYPDLHLPGCHLVNLPTGKRTRVACAIFCSTDSNSAAFKFDDVTSDCMKCRRNEVTGITFLSGQSTSLQRVTRQINWFEGIENVCRSLVVPGGLKVGMVVHLTGMVLSNVHFCINFDQAVDQTNINLHFCARKQGPYMDPTLLFNHLNSNTWGDEIDPVMSPYPFTANTTTRLHILVREDMFVWYIDNKFCCNYTHVVGMLYTKVNYIRVCNGIKVYDISI